MLIKLSLYNVMTFVVVSVGIKRVCCTYNNLGKCAVVFFIWRQGTCIYSRIGTYSARGYSRKYSKPSLYRKFVIMII